jgi:hypothetical protein
LQTRWLYVSQTPPSEPKFAVEIPGAANISPTYTLLGDNGVTSLNFDLKRLDGADPNMRRPSALELIYELNGDSVLIEASVVFGDFDRQRAPQSLANLPREPVGKYSAKLNDSVTLSAMERFGLEPVTLKIVTAEPPTSFRPQAISKASSVRIEIVGEDRTSYKVTARNMSAKTVAALQIETCEDSSSTGRTESGSDLIAPGETYRFQVSIPHGRTLSNGVMKENPMPLFLSLETVVFRDGSYEGEVQGAAEYAARAKGIEVQRKRADAIVEPILADTQLDDNSKTARIRSEVDRLTVEPDTQSIDSVRSGFPGLPDQALDSVRFGLRVGLNSGKQAVTFGLVDFERNKAYIRNLTLKSWWSLWRNP